MRGKDSIFMFTKRSISMSKVNWFTQARKKNRIRKIQIVVSYEHQKRKSTQVNRPVEAFVVDCFTLR